MEDRTVMTYTLAPTVLILIYPINSSDEKLAYGLQTLATVCAHTCMGVCFHVHKQSTSGVYLVKVACEDNNYTSRLTPKVDGLQQLPNHDRLFHLLLSGLGSVLEKVFFMLSHDSR